VPNHEHALGSSSATQEELATDTLQDRSLDESIASGKLGVDESDLSDTVHKISSLGLDSRAL